VNLTTRQKADAALAIPCPVHGTPAGEACTSPRGALAGSCLFRRESALEPIDPAGHEDFAEAAR
jgi:hypothetical protein